MWQRFAPALPANPWNWIAVWRRNFLVWRKVALASILGNLAEPMSSLFGLGFGLGMIVGGVEGTSYIAFLAAGMVATSAMVSSTFETIYGAYARMQTGCTWEAVLCTPLTLGDIVLGEVAWAASKALLAGTAITIVAVALGYAEWSSIPYALPAIALTGVAFASLAMVVSALAPSHDYFIFYQSLILTPMMYLSGAIFPISQLPGSFQRIAALLPLTHSVDLIRPAMLGRPVDSVGLHVGALCICAALPFIVSAALLRQRLMR
ncbi:ABC transporter permease [Bradyrhizobium sp. USDA 3650]